MARRRSVMTCRAILLACGSKCWPRITLSPQVRTCPRLTRENEEHMVRGFPPGGVSSPPHPPACRHWEMLLSHKPVSGHLFRLWGRGFVARLPSPPRGLLLNRRPLFSSPLSLSLNPLSFFLFSALVWSVLANTVLMDSPPLFTSSPPLSPPPSLSLYLSLWGILSPSCGYRFCSHPV